MEVRVSETIPYLPGTSCAGWIPLQNPAFHLSMLAYVIAFVIPQTFKHYVTTIRVAILVAIFLGMIWGAMYWCTWDILLWGAVFFIQNFVQLIFALYHLRRINLPAELEYIYHEAFQPFGVTRAEFKALVRHNCKTIRLHPGDKYSVEGCTSVDERVSLLVTGSMRVLFRGEHLHEIRKVELIDSPEWESSKLKRGEIFQVTVEAVERCSYLCWNREKLQFYLEENPKLMSAFQYFRGNDILKKIHGTAIAACRRNMKDDEQREEIESVCVTNIRKGLADEDPSAIYSQQS